MASGGYGNADRNSPEVAVVRAIYDAFARRDVEAALAHIADDVVFAPQGTASRAGRQAPYLGHDGVRQYFADVERLWEDLRIHAEDVRSVAGSVVVFGHVEGRIDGDAVQRRAIWVWEVRDGKATSMRVNDVGDVTPR